MTKPARSQDNCVESPRHSFMMNSNALVSVVIPYHNEGGLVCRAIESVRMQNYAGRIEIIVVDDASDDPATDHVSPADDLRIVRNRVNLHAAGSRNVGIASASGKYICFLDADDVYLDGRIQPHVGFLENYCELALVGSAGIILREEAVCQFDLPLIRKVCGGIPSEPTILPLSVAEDAFLHYPCHTCGFTVRADVLKSLGGFNDSYRWGEEWDLYVRIAQQHRVGFIPGQVYRYVRREGSICSSNSADKFLRMAKLYRDWRRMRPLPREHTRAIRAREHNSLLLAAQFFFEEERHVGAAWACAARAALCGMSVWGLRSLIRISGNLPFVVLHGSKGRKRRDTLDMVQC